MKPKNIVLLDQRDSPWYGFLSEYFEDSASRLEYSYEPLKMGSFLDEVSPDVVFVDNAHISLGVAQKLKLLRQSNPDFRVFHLGEEKKKLTGLTFDDIFIEPLQLVGFQKQLVQSLPLPQKIRVLLIDDETEIVANMKEYLENRMQPLVEIQHALNGKIGLETLQKGDFDVVVLDIKMPVMNGREVYREIKAKGIETPVIIFFDAIFGDEILEIHQYGRPAVVEKGSKTSAMPEMVSLIKKVVYFG